MGTAKRVLVVTSSYNPAMLADMHRARLLAWDLRQHDWQVELLSPDASFQDPQWMESDSAAFFAPAATVHMASSRASRMMRHLGLRNVGWRALPAVLMRGLRLLRSHRFELVYISTTQFPLFLAGPIWRALAGVPYVLDLHDPCFRDDPAPPIWTRQRWKYRLSRAVARYIERLSVVRAAAIVAVSPAYLDTMRARYGGQRPIWMNRKEAVIPFAASPRDLDEARRTRRPLSSNKITRIVYVGAGGPIMERAFGILCEALACLRQTDPRALDGVVIQLRGTMAGWVPGAPRHLFDVAHHYGVEDVVEEDPRRVTYRTSLEILLEADGALILGVDDRGYMPSKLATYALSGKPLLGIVRRDGPAFEQMSNLRDTKTVWFEPSGQMPPKEAAEAVRQFLAQARSAESVDRTAAIAAMLSDEMARRHARLFELAISP